MRFENQVVVVTGAASGIGLATAKAFAAEGAQLALTDISAAAISSTLEAVGGDALGLVGDVSDPATVHEHVEAVMDKYGRINVLVNNAGIIRREPTTGVSADDWRRVMSVNVDGTFFWAQTVAVRSMIPRRSGAIVNVASTSGLEAQPNSASYVASKHAVVGLTKSFAVDWGQYDIRVNAICPGVTWSNLSKADYQKNPQHYATRIPRVPLNRAAEAEEQASVILFLASPAASHVHGAILSVDGGQAALSSGHNPARDD